MRVLYLPDWVFTALKAQGHQRSDSLDEKILTSILSIDDVVFLSLIQDKIDSVVPQSVLDTFPVEGFRCWPKAAMDEDHRDARLNLFVNGLPEEYITPLSNLGCEMMDEDTLVFYPLIPLDQYELKSSNMSDVTLSKLDLLDRVIQEIYPYITFSDLALTPIMRDYLVTANACREGFQNTSLKAAA